MVVLQSLYLPQSSLHRVVLRQAQYIVRHTIYIYVTREVDVHRDATATADSPGSSVLPTAIPVEQTVIPIESLFGGCGSKSATLQRSTIGPEHRGEGRGASETVEGEPVAELDSLLTRTKIGTRRRGRGRGVECSQENTVMTRQRATVSQCCFFGRIISAISLRKLR